MMLQEFTQLTGIELTAEEYREIEAAYYDFDGDKKEFCRNVIETGVDRQLCQARMERIRQLECLLDENEKKHQADKAQMMQKMEKLQQELDKELCWEPAEDTGTNMSQERYEALRDCRVGTHMMSDEEAKQLIFEEFGFSPHKVVIIKTVHTYEVNKYRQLRKSHQYERFPLYNATDWNYVRFNCINWQWEMVNGELIPYCC